MQAVKYFADHSLTFFEIHAQYPMSAPFRIPKSYEGMSGGAVWRFYVMEKGQEIEVVGSRLIGVPFFQILAQDGKGQIVCHAAKDVYGRLIDALRIRWPEEVS
jgi:hypothetical protein